MPAAPRALETELLRRLAAFESELREVHEVVTRIAANADAAGRDAVALKDSFTKLETRVRVLEDSRNQAKGAIWAGRAFWVGLVAAAGIIGKLWR